MSLELLRPVEEESLLGLALLPKQVLGKNIAIHTTSLGLPELKGLHVALIGLSEYRNSFFPKHSVRPCKIQKSVLRIVSRKLECKNR